MDLPDNNVLINAFRPETRHHQTANAWLTKALSGGHSIRLFPTVEAGFVRVVTNPKIFDPPSLLTEARDFLETLGSCPTVEISQWTEACRQRWGKLCEDLGMSGNDCNDAMLAALALEKGLRLVTFDRGFRRFPHLQLMLLED